MGGGDGQAEEVSTASAGPKEPQRRALWPPKRGCFEGYPHYPQTGYPPIVDKITQQNQGFLKSIHILSTKLSTKMRGYPQAGMDEKRIDSTTTYYTTNDRKRKASNHKRSVFTVQTVAVPFGRGQGKQDHCHCCFSRPPARPFPRLHTHSTTLPFFCPWPCMAPHGLDNGGTKQDGEEDAGEGTLFVPKSIPSPDPTREKAVFICKEIHPCPDAGSPTSMQRCNGRG